MRVPALLTVLTVAIPIGFCAGTASAEFFEGQSFIFGRTHVYEGPWCAHNNTGADRVEEDCSFASFEACNREAQLNRGFCTQNFQGTVVPTRRSKGDRLRR